MREILFRAKRLDNGEWAESRSIAENEFEESGEKHYYIGARNPAIQGVDEHGNIMDAETLGECLFYACDPETIGQYTGLEDKNGKKIFEGDIVDVNGYAYAVRWDEGNVEFGLYNKYESLGIAYVYPETTVVGNIHDNPELLKEVKL